MIKMEIVEGRELGKMFRQRGRRAKTAVDRILLQSAAKVAREARKNVPKKGGHGRRPTGRLKASIAHKLIRLREGLTDALVGTKTFYGAFLEFGTGPAGKASGAKSVGNWKVHKYGDGRGRKMSTIYIAALRASGQKVRKARRKEIESMMDGAERGRGREEVGMPAHPWLGPSYQQFVRKIENDMAKVAMDGD